LSDALGLDTAHVIGKGIEFVAQFQIQSSPIWILLPRTMNVIALYSKCQTASNRISSTYRNKNLQGHSFRQKQLNVALFNNVVDGIDERQINWRHYVRE
jgi:hypothetical protein